MAFTARGPARSKPSVDPSGIGSLYSIRENGMKKASAKRKSLPRKPMARRAKEIQTVFDRLGLGSDQSRRGARLVYEPVPEKPVQYKVILSGSSIL